MVLAAVLAPDSTAVDVGAHRGTVLREIIRVAPRGRHIAFEALPALAADLRRDFPTVDVREVALAAAAGHASFVHAVNNPGYSGLRERELPPNTQVETITVRTGRLDDEIGDLAPAVVKIDVEGGELAVLQGAADTLERYRPVVWFEHGQGAADRYGTTPEAVWDLLASVGLRVYDVDARGPLSRDEMAESFALSRVWNYLANA